MKSILNLGRFFSNHPLTRDAPLYAWGRFVSWQIRSRLQDEVIIQWIGEQRLAVRNGMAGATGNLYTGLHEFADMMLLLHFLRKEDFFLDIGANVGTYTVLASGVCKAKTWAFEPDPDTFRHLNRNVAINGLDELVRLYNCALGASEGEVRFTVGLDTVNRVAADQDRNTRSIRQRSLDTIVSDKSPIMIKIDVEGYEEEVLCGSQRMLANQSLKVIEMETVTPRSQTMLGDYNFQRAFYDPFSRRLCQSPLEYPSSNALFVRDLKYVATRLVEAEPVTIFGRKI
jgi:FkbM family methyltransferase